MKIIIQAGGKGTRLEGLTRNKPKSLVPVNNLPIIFHLFRKFHNADFIIIADYKIEVITKYLKTFGSDYKYKIIKAAQKGTVSGINEALRSFSDYEQVVITWCDLIYPDEFQIPSDKGNYIGISKCFECRWSYLNGDFFEKPSAVNGVAGLFAFENKQLLKDLPDEGAFVEWLQHQRIDFKELRLDDTKEVGTMLTYNECQENIPRCRPFNSMKFDKNIVVKTPIDEQGRKIAISEIAWYKHVKKLGYRFIPEVLEYNPLTMKRVYGKNIYEYDCLTKTQKKEILKKLIEALQSLHDLEPGRPVNPGDVRDIYITKTFDRLSVIQNLVPFADREFLKINGQYYKNVFFSKDELAAEVEKYIPAEFKLIHGDCTFSNLMLDTFDMRAVLIDPRGYFGKTALYGDVDYDWAKLYYSINGRYDQFNQKKFSLDIREKDVELAINPNNWSDMEDYYFEYLPQVNRKKIKLLHAVIWLSLTTYAWEDYDSICGAFYHGIIKLSEVL